MKYCVYSDGSTDSLPSGSTCEPKWPLALMDEYEIPDTSIEVHNNLTWFNIIIVGLFFLPAMFKSKGK